MALTKTQLKEILSKAGVPAENADAAIAAIMDGHLASVNALREERDTYKADAEKLPGVQKELDELKSDRSSSYKTMYEKEHKEFEDFKAQQIAKETKANKTSAFRALLKEAGISDKRIDAVVRASAPDIDSLELDKDGKIKGAEDLTKTVKENWADFITTPGEKGADTPTPPDSKDNGKTVNPRAAQLYKEHYNTLYGKGEQK